MIIDVECPRCNGTEVNSNEVDLIAMALCKADGNCECGSEIECMVRDGIFGKLARAAMDRATDKLAEENARLRKALKAIMELPSEINPSNYEHDDVWFLNAKFIEAYYIARAALKGTPHE